MQSYPNLPQVLPLHHPEHLEEAMQQECWNHECAHVNSSFQHIIGPVLIEQRDSYAGG